MTAAPPELQVVEAIGRIMEFWGFRRSLGRIWAWLYLSPHPCTAAELCEGLGMSAGAVSMGLSELERWGAAHRQALPGDRRDFFGAERDVWATVRRVLAQRELREVDEAEAAFRGAEQALRQRLAGAEDADDRHRLARVAELVELARAGQDLLRLLVLPTEQAPPSESRPRLPRVR